MFKKANLNFNKETLLCCFIFLLKKTDSYLNVRRNDFIEFVQSSGAKAHDFTMTGGNFPVETELVYSSDSDNGEVTSTTKNNVSKAKETVTETS